MLTQAKRTLDKPTGETAIRGTDFRLQKGGLGSPQFSTVPLDGGGREDTRGNDK